MILTFCFGRGYCPIEFCLTRYLSSLTINFALCQQNISQVFHDLDRYRAVVDRIIKSASNLNEIVLDPFMGSGTAAIAALGLQRQVIGFEIRADYCDIAASRIDIFLIDKGIREAQLSLF